MKFLWVSLHCTKSFTCKAQPFPVSPRRDYQGKHLCDDSTASPGRQFQGSVTLPVKQPLAGQREPAVLQSVLLHTEPCTHLFLQAPMKARVPIWPLCPGTIGQTVEGSCHTSSTYSGTNQPHPRCCCKYPRELMLIFKTFSFKEDQNLTVYHPSWKWLSPELCNSCCLKSLTQKSRMCLCTQPGNFWVWVSTVLIATLWVIKGIDRIRTELSLGRKGSGQRRQGEESIFYHVRERNKFFKMHRNGDLKQPAQQQPFGGKYCRILKDKSA